MPDSLLNAIKELREEEQEVADALSERPWSVDTTSEEARERFVSELDDIISDFEDNE